MPIITPAYPQQNSSFNVTKSARCILEEAFQAGLAITQEIELGKSSWEILFESSSYFAKYKHYIVLLASSNTAAEQVEWCGLVESQIRHLISLLERNEHIDVAHINPETFIPKNIEVDNHISMWLIGLKLHTTKNLNLDLTHEIKYFVKASKYC